MTQPDDNLRIHVCTKEDQDTDPLFGAIREHPHIVLVIKETPATPSAQELRKTVHSAPFSEDPNSTVSSYYAFLDKIGCRHLVHPDSGQRVPVIYAVYSSTPLATLSDAGLVLPHGWACCPSFLEPGDLERRALVGSHRRVLLTDSFIRPATFNRLPIGTHGPRLARILYPVIMRQAIRDMTACCRILGLDPRASIHIGDHLPLTDPQKLACHNLVPAIWHFNPENLEVDHVMEGDPYVPLTADEPAALKCPVCNVVHSSDDKPGTAVTHRVLTALSRLKDLDRPNESLAPSLKDSFGLSNPSDPDTDNPNPEEPA